MSILVHSKICIRGSGRTRISGGVRPPICVRVCMYGPDTLRLLFSFCGLLYYILDSYVTYEKKILYKFFVVVFELDATHGTPVYLKVVIPRLASQKYFSLGKQWDEDAQHRVVGFLHWMELGFYVLFTVFKTVRCFYWSSLTTQGPESNYSIFSNNGGSYN